MGGHAFLSHPNKKNFTGYSSTDMKIWPPNPDHEKLVKL